MTPATLPLNAMLLFGVAATPAQAAPQAGDPFADALAEAQAAPARLQPDGANLVAATALAAMPDLQVPQPIPATGEIGPDCTVPVPPDPVSTDKAPATKPASAQPGPRHQVRGRVARTPEAATSDKGGAPDPVPVTAGLPLVAPQLPAARQAAESFTADQEHPPAAPRTTSAVNAEPKPQPQHLSAPSSQPAPSAIETPSSTAREVPASEPSAAAPAQVTPDLSVSPATAHAASVPPSPHAPAMRLQPTDAAPASPVEQAAYQASIVYRASAAQQHVTVKLDPAELGAITFRLSTAGGHRSLDIAVERPETLKMLLADGDTLHRALDKAGVPAENRTISLSVEPPPVPVNAPSVPDAPAMPAGTASTPLGSGGEGGSRGREAFSGTASPGLVAEEDTAPPIRHAAYAQRALDIVA
jgi:flagellar hook-length control protein FliK